MLRLIKSFIFKPFITVLCISFLTVLPSASAYGEGTPKVSEPTLKSPQIKHGIIEKLKKPKNFVGIEKAKIVAKNWYEMNAPEGVTNYDVKEVIPTNYQGETTYYVVTFQQGGYVIVSANQATSPVIGYSYYSDYNKNVLDIPEAKSFFNIYNKRIYSVINKNISSKNTIRLWESILRKQKIKSSQRSIHMPPLLTTKWGQHNPFNDYCPKIGEENTLVGCVAVAMGQVMNYYKYPLQGSGEESYFWLGGFEFLSADFGNTTYRWDLMPDIVSYRTTDESINAVAKLLHHCGVAVNMEYDTDGSSAKTRDVEEALEEYFKYDERAKFIERYSSNYRWKQLLKHELACFRPVVYRGRTEDSGHAFVIDGYDSNDFFHINFGWRGAMDGYYDLWNIVGANVLDNPEDAEHLSSDRDYASDQAAIINIMPESDPYENNNTESRAYELDLDFSGDYGEIIIDDASVSPLNDIDYFYFMLPHDNLSYNIEIEVTHPNVIDRFPAQVAYKIGQRNAQWSSLLSTPSFVSSGNRIVYIKVSPNNRYVTSRYRLKVSVARAHADLAIRNVKINKRQVSLGSGAHVEFNLHNLGYSYAQNPTVECWLSRDLKLDTKNDVYLDKYEVRHISGQSSIFISEDVRIPKDIARGKWYLLIAADRLDLIRESNENNNISFGIMEGVLPNPDLTVSSFRADKNAVLAGTNLKVNCFVNNLGPGPAKCSTLRFYLSDDKSYNSTDRWVGSAHVKNLECRDMQRIEEELKIPADAVGKVQYILAVADESNSVAETKEYNNVAWTQIDVKRQADLITKNITTNSYKTAPGSAVLVEYDVENIGPVAAHPTKLKFYLSRDKVLSYTDYDLDSATLWGGTQVRMLNGGEKVSLKRSVSLPSNIGSGIWYILLRADADNKVNEFDELNNISSKQIQVTTELPDLQITDYYTLRDIIVPGSTVDVRCRVSNSGTERSPASTLKYCLSKTPTGNFYDIALDTLTISELRPSESRFVNKTLTIPSNLGYGEWYLVVKADPDGRISETDENNNTAYKRVAYDQYEPNNQISSAYEFAGNSVDWNSRNAAVIKTVGTSIDSQTDVDCFKLTLPNGHSYRISARVHDRNSSTDGKSYTCDVKFSYKKDADWSKEVDVACGEIITKNASTVYFKVLPSYASETGTYSLEITITRE